MPDFALLVIIFSVINATLLISVAHKEKNSTILDITTRFFTLFVFNRIDNLLPIKHIRTIEQ